MRVCGNGCVRIAGTVACIVQAVKCGTVTSGVRPARLRAWCYEASVLKYQYFANGPRPEPAVSNYKRNEIINRKKLAININIK